MYPIFRDPDLAKEEECRKEQKDKRFSCLFRDIAIQILWGVASKDLDSPYKYLKTKYKRTFLRIRLVQFD
jgi:hypothetical protein